MEDILIILFKVIPSAWPINKTEFVLYWSKRSYAGTKDCVMSLCPDAYWEDIKAVDWGTWNWAIYWITLALA